MSSPGIHRGQTPRTARYGPNLPRNNSAPPTILDEFAPVLLLSEPRERIKQPETELWCAVVGMALNDLMLYRNTASLRSASRRIMIEESIAFFEEQEPCRILSFAWGCDQCGIDHDAALEELRPHLDAALEAIARHKPRPRRIDPLNFVATSVKGCLSDATLEFIEHWNASETIDEVVERTGRERDSAQVKASSLRSRGYYLKKMAAVRMGVFR